MGIAKGTTYPQTKSYAGASTGIIRRFDKIIPPIKAITQPVEKPRLISFKENA
jgi:hypothetical protein